MTTSTPQSGAGLKSLLHGVAALIAMLVVSWPNAARAIPLFARQTGQNCVACHAGGQFPELTPYGRLFKMTGYTIGERTSAPVSAMVLGSVSKVSNTSKSDDPGQDFQKNNNLIFATASVFLGGKITDRIGAFAQVTYDPYAAQAPDGHFTSQTNVDNVDIRYADRFIDAKSDFIFGFSFNNNPSISDPWNTAPAWMQYVPVPSPTSSRFIDGNAPYPGYGAGGNIAGLTAYGYWNNTWYAELGGYATSRNLSTPMSWGIHSDSKTQLSGINPYVRLAWNHEWGAHSLMVGTAGMIARVYDGVDTTDSSTRHKVQDWNIDAQYQYLLDPHSVTAQVVYAHSNFTYSDATANQPSAFVDANGNALPNSNAADTTNVFRAKLTYVYQAKYGGSVGIFNLSGSTNTFNQTSGYTTDGESPPAITSDTSVRVGGNLSGNPGTRGATFEAFWTPIQYMRLGAQYTAYNRYNGASDNYDGFGRNARDNNTFFLYLWAAY